MTVGQDSVRVNILEKVLKYLWYKYVSRCVLVIPKRVPAPKHPT